MSPDQIAEVFTALGRIEQKIDNQHDWMNRHVADDEITKARVGKLETSHARQKGFFTALAGAGSVIGALIGYAVEFFGGRHH